MTIEIQKISKDEITLNDVWDIIITIQNRNVILDSEGWKNLKSEFSISSWGCRENITYN
jgi:hypothetical protein